MGAGLREVVSGNRVPGTWEAGTTGAGVAKGVPMGTNLTQPTRTTSARKRKVPKAVEAPGQLHIAVESLVWRLVDRVEVVDVANGFYMGQQTRGDHECKEVHSY